MHSTRLLTIIVLLLLGLVIVTGKKISKQNDTIRLMEKCLNYSDNILDYNGVWDKDGSDYMSDYLELRHELDSTFSEEFHKKYNN